MTTRNDAAARAPGFPELREQPVQQSVRQYLIEGPELFACSPLSGRSEFVSQRGRPQVSPSFERELMARREGEKFMARRLAPGFPELREQPVQQSVRQYLIEGPELFACSPLSGRSEFVSQRP